MSEAAVTVRGLVNQFGNNRVHDKLNLEVKQGEIFSIVGGSGSGKSVLLRKLEALAVRPKHGSGSGNRPYQCPIGSPVGQGVEGVSGQKRSRSARLRESFVSRWMLLGSG